MRLKKSGLIAFLLTVLIAPVNAQKNFADSLFKINKLSLGVEGGFYYYSPSNGDVVLLPDILSQRRKNQDAQAAWGLYENANHQNELTDNPLIHGAGYLTLHAKDE